MLKHLLQDFESMSDQVALKSLKSFRFRKVFLFFFYRGFLSQQFTNLRIAGEGGGHLLH